MVEEEENDDEVAEPTPPLFTSDLGPNGGVFAPTSVEEMNDWVTTEFGFWTWAYNVSAGGYKSVFDNALQPLGTAVAQAREAVALKARRIEDAQLYERIKMVQDHVHEAFMTRRLPHSSSPLALRAAGLSAEPQAALAYLFPFLQSYQSPRHQFDGRDTQAWRGFLMGMIDHFGIVTNVEPVIEAQRASVDNLLARGEGLLDKKKKALEKLHRDFNEIKRNIEIESGSHREDFATLVKESEQEHSNAINTHQSEMEVLRKTFREEMTLREPVEYWKEKAKKHQAQSESLKYQAFGAMALLAVALGGMAAWVFATLVDGRPDSWKVAVLILIGVIGVWAVRLIVRMYLSHTHLATDADERVTMVMTYLALLEGEKMPSDEDRKLVLAPLFRPATDGIVKDEGLPHPMLELFTRTGGKP